MARFVPNAMVQLIVSYEDLLIGKAGELLDERGDTCVVNFGDDEEPDIREVPTIDLEAVDADDEYQDDDPDGLLKQLIAITKPFHDRLDEPVPMGGVNDDEDLDALEGLLSLTEPFKGEMDPAIRKEWERISATAADLRLADDQDIDVDDVEA